MHQPTVYIYSIVSEMNRSRMASPHARSKSRDRAPPTNQLVSFLKLNYPKEIPISLITGLSKVYGKDTPIQADDKFFRTFATGKAINTKKFLEYLQEQPQYDKGRSLGNQTIGRICKTYSNDDGDLTFEYLMKMGEEVDVPISEKIAKGMVRKYGKGKKHLSIADLIRVNEKRQEAKQQQASRSAKKR